MYIGVVDAEAGLRNRVFMNYRDGQAAPMDSLRLKMSNGVFSMQNGYLIYNSKEKKERRVGEKILTKATRRVGSGESWFCLA